MSWFTIEPRDPLMVRDGRPFGLDTEGARSQDFPPPSVTAGMVRSRIGFAKGQDGTFGLSPGQARAISVQGPLLLSLSGPSTEAPTLLLAAPRDCVLFPVEGREDQWERHRLAPQAVPGEPRPSSLPASLAAVVPVAEMPAAKAAAGPAFWTAKELESWLAAPAPSPDTLERSRTRPALVHERRIHVAIDPHTGTAEDGKLFQTDGLRFEQHVGPPFQVERLAVAIRCDDPALRPGLATLGGERRLSVLQPLASDPTWAAPSLGESRRARVVLLTPALFDSGAIPATIAGATVVAAAVGRPQVVSGWDMAVRGPKATRRMAPAGSVYWVELPANNAPSDWAKKVHFQSISDQEQDQRDGFGLAAVGVWA